MKKLFLLPLFLILTVCATSLQVLATGPGKPPKPSAAAKLHIKKKANLEQRSSLSYAEGMLTRAQSQKLSYQLKRSEKFEASVHKISKESTTSLSTQQLLSPILNDKHLLSNLDVISALERVWNLQEQTNNDRLFVSFVSKYYAQNFGVISPHLATLFEKIDSFQNRDLETRFLQRVQYIARNRGLLAKEVLPPTILGNLTNKSFRLRYLSDIRKLDEENFQPDQLVLSIERRMSPNPDKDLPLDPINGRSLFFVKDDPFMVFNFNGPLEALPQLYLFLLNGPDDPQPVTAIWDEQTKALAMYNHDRSRWLRISSHEYSHPERLHIHLNQSKVVEFTDADGNSSREQVNLNLSIPFAKPANLPPNHVQDFLYQKLIVNPVKVFKRNKLVTIKQRPIF